MKKTTAKNRGASAGQQGSDLPKLSQPALRALASAGVHKLKQLTKFSEAEVKQWHGIGPNALASLRRALAEQGLSFANQQNRTN